MKEETVKFDCGAAASVDPRRAGRRLVALYVLLIGGNLAAWAAAFVAFHGRPALLATALLAYSLGLRHAFDADHIASIDNVTRKLMQRGQRPMLAGLHFSLGHSTVVVGLTVAIALGAATMRERFGVLKDLSQTVGTAVSVLFLLSIAAANLLVLIQVAGAFRRITRGSPAERAIPATALKPGPLGQLLRPAFALIGRSWHMYPLGLAFGLSFDTATEIGLLGISASQASQGLPIWSILVFPALFTAGMSLIDTTDSVIMTGAYGWAFTQPARKLLYNMTVTFTSVIAALAVGGIEGLGLIGDSLQLDGPFWRLVGWLNDNTTALGYAIVCFFLTSWLGSFVWYKRRIRPFASSGATTP